MLLRHIMGVSLLLASAGLLAEETKTTYSISGSSVTVTTMIKKVSAEKEKLLKKYLFEAVAERLRALPMVSGVEFNNELKGEVTGSTWADYWEHKRSYPVMVSLSLGTPVTLMLKVEESFRVCKSLAEKNANQTTPTSSYSPWDDYGGSSSSSQSVDCTLNSSAKITGPFAVYGNFASSTNMEGLLKERQSISYELSRDWSDKTSLKLDGRFVIESELFDVNLMKFLGGLNSSPGAETVINRNALLLGIARVLRVQNEGMVEK